MKQTWCARWEEEGMSHVIYIPVIGDERIARIALKLTLKGLGCEMPQNYSLALVAPLVHQPKSLVTNGASLRRSQGSSDREKKERLLSKGQELYDHRRHYHPDFLPCR